MGEKRKVNIAVTIAEYLLSYCTSQERESILESLRQGIVPSQATIVNGQVVVLVPAEA